MPSRKILFRLVPLVLMLIFCQTLSAEAKIDKWSDTNYPFKSIKAVYIENIKLAAPGLSDIETKNLQTDFWKQVNREQPYTVITYEQLIRKLSLSEGRDLDALRNSNPAAFDDYMRNNMSRVVTAYAKTVMDEYKIGSYVVPAHTEWRTRYVKDHYYDRDGNRHETTREERYPEFVPERTVYTDTIHMRLDVYDAKTHQVIFSREEYRTDDNSRDLSGMFGEITRGCLRDFREKISD